MRTTELRSLTSTLVGKSARCAGSHQQLRLNGFSMSTVRFKTCSGLVDTISKHFIIASFGSGLSPTGETLLVPDEQKLYPRLF